MPDIRTPVIRTITRFTESFVSYSIEFLPDIRTFHAGYKNHLQKTVLIYYCIFYAGYKNMFVYTISTVLTTYQWRTQGGGQGGHGPPEIFLIVGLIRLPINNI